MASMICSRAARTGWISLFRMNCSFWTVSKSVGSLMMILRAPFSWDRGRTTFSRATDSGTSSMTDGGDGHLGQVDELHAVELGDGAHDLFGGGVAELDEGVLELGAGLLLKVPGFLRADRG